MTRLAAPFIALFLIACGGDDSPQVDLSSGDDIDPVGDISDPPDEAEDGSGTLWTCTLGGWGDDGITYVEFEDVLDFCFTDGAHANDFTTGWLDDCADAFEADGFSTYDCFASCDNTDSGC